MIVFVSGGARSGKSRFAEQYVFSLFEAKKSLGHNGSIFYIATAIRSDKEMEKRIDKHIQSRSFEWKTIEAPFDLYPAMANLAHGDIVLVDCLTIWLSNLLFEKEMPSLHVIHHFRTLLNLVKKKGLSLVVVSNDLNEGIPLKNDEVCRYIYTLELLHKEIVTLADEVIQVAAGIPLYWKMRS